MKTLPLTNSNKTFIIDDEDYEKVSQYNWQLSGFGYVHTSVSSFTTLYLHKFLLGTSSKVDHKDRNKLNFQKENLRVCEHNFNLHNQAKKLNRKNLKSKYKGVAWSNSMHKWVVRISFKKKEIWGGGFTSENDAALMANALMMQYHGEFAVLNKVS